MAVALVFPCEQFAVVLADDEVGPVVAVEVAEGQSLGVAVHDEAGLGGRLDAERAIGPVLEDHPDAAPPQAGLRLSGEHVLHGDNRPDFVVCQNNGKLLAWKNQSDSQPLFSVHLNGSPGNPDGIGARIIAHYTDGTIHAAEMTAGNGYLSQSQPIVYFSAAGTPIKELEIRWPDGETTKANPDTKSSSIEISKRLLSKTTR